MGSKRRKSLTSKRNRNVVETNNTTEDGATNAASHATDVTVAAAAIKSQPRRMSSRRKRSSSIIPSPSTRPRRAKRARFASETPSLTYFETLPHDVSGIVAKHALAAEASVPLMKYLLTAKGNAATALRLASSGGSLGAGACLSFGHWIEYDMVTTGDVENVADGVLMLETRGSEYKVIRKLAQLVKDNWTSITFRNFAVTKCYANIIRVHGVNLKRIEIDWSKRFFRWSSISPAELAGKLDAIFAAAGTLETVVLNLHSLQMPLVGVIAKYLGNWESVVLSFDEVMEFGILDRVKLDPIWKKIGNDEHGILKNLEVNTPVVEDGEEFGETFVIKESALCFKVLEMMKRKVNISVNGEFW